MQLEGRLLVVWLTRKLYYEDMYMREFEATVVKVDGSRVILDQTCFYPEGGGQVGDTGWIGEYRVVDTQLEGDEVVHYLEKPAPLKPGDRVKCRIDWDRRYRIMRLHSAAHIMEYFLHKVFGPLERVGSRVDERKDRSDYAYEGRLDPVKLKEVEELCNKFIAEGHEIRVETPPDRPGFRVWRCAGIEMPCGGMHVKNTREIGRIRLKRRNPGRGVERVETYLVD
ncbi:MAG: alanyl-tRNA editing protein [Thermoproteota archaeon]|nr:MAG: alanyl-tRNA editing protein [Candidatus Korarchaeota archaeon]